MNIKKIIKTFLCRKNQNESVCETGIPGRMDLPEIYQQLRNRYPHLKTIKTFVETGTFRGDTVRKMEHSFEKLITIEIDPRLHQEAKARHASPKIHYVLGDSATELKKIAQELSEPALFYLDAHFSGMGTGKGAKDVPLIEEMELLAQRTYADCIIVDDLRLFGTHANKEDWSAVTKDSILGVFNHQNLDSFEQGDKLILLRHPIRADSH